MLTIFNIIKTIRHRHDIQQLFSSGYSPNLKLKFSQLNQNDIKTLFNTNNDYIWKLCKTQLHLDHFPIYESYRGYLFSCSFINNDSVENDDIHLKLKLVKVDNILRVQSNKHDYIAITNDYKWFKKYIYNDLYKPTICWWFICVIIDVLLILSIVSSCM